MSQNTRLFDENTVASRNVLAFIVANNGIILRIVWCDQDEIQQVVARVVFTLALSMIVPLIAIERENEDMHDFDLARAYFESDSGPNALIEFSNQLFVGQMTQLLDQFFDNVEIVYLNFS